MRGNNPPTKPKPNLIISGQKFNPCRGCIKKCDPEYAKYCKAKRLY